MLRGSGGVSIGRYISTKKSAAFVKLVLPEAGSEQARRIWRDASACHASVALLAEARAALGRARRVARLAGEEHDAAVGRLLDLCPEMEVLELTESLAHRAGELAERCALRGYDAIHLASAEAILDEGDVMVVSDERIAQAAASIGIEALIPAER